MKGLQHSAAGYGTLALGVGPGAEDVELEI